LVQGTIPPKVGRPGPRTPKGGSSPAMGGSTRCSRSGRAAVCRSAGALPRIGAKGRRNRGCAKRGCAWPHEGTREQSRVDPFPRPGRPGLPCRLLTSPVAHRPADEDAASGRGEVGDDKQSVHAATLTGCRPLMPAGSGGQRNTSTSACDGVLKPRVCRGRPLSRSAMASKSSWVRVRKSSRLGRY
jgi:hypothetical protein